MRNSTPLLALALALLAAPPASAQSASGDGTRFDVQSFRPSGSPQDLVMVGQSRPMAHLSLSLGLVVNYSLDPLVLISQNSQQKLISVVGNRLQLDAVAAIGLFDWIELGVAMPLVLSQTSDNLESIGTEGTIRSLAQGDLRLNAKVAIPGLRRQAEGSGFGAAVTFGLSFPTGVQQAFTSDGQMTMSPGAVLDYRFDWGLLLAVNGGFWSRPVAEFNGLKLGPLATFGAAAEIPIIRGWGVTAVGELYGSASVETDANGKRSVPAEALLGLRWYSSTGLTFTVGGGGGCGCSFSSPTLRLFASIIWVPGKTNEYEALERFKNPPPPPVDPDGDGVIGEKDRCPNVSGPVENGGCPDEDRDRDGLVDRLDKCPDKPAARGRGKDGCPLAEIQGDQIVIADQVYFAFDKDVILDESFAVLDEVVRIIQEHPEFERVRVEGHTDNIASQSYNLNLSARRSSSVERYLLGKGIDVKRLRSSGLGMNRPIADNGTEEGRQLNRRVEFHIERGVTRPGAGGQSPQGDAAMPKVFVQGNRIATADPIRFLPDDQLAPESRPLVEGVARLVRKDAQIDRVRIEVRAVRAGEDALTQARRRAATLEQALLAEGVERKRLRSVASFSEQGGAQADGNAVDFTITLRTDNSKDPVGKGGAPRK